MLVVVPIPPSPQAPRGRALLVERAAGGLAHEAKNPLHNMVLHLQLVAEKLPSSAAPALERHIQAMRDGIARVDALLRAFSQLAAPARMAGDLGQALSSALLLFSFQARRGNVKILRHGPSEARVEADGALLDELVSNAVLLGIALAQDGTLELSIVSDGTRAARLDMRAESLAPRRADALPHLEEVRRLASELQAERSIDPDSAPVARLSLTFAQSR
jgi:C4-dicarboxylate-specific signal transduction histidine kinase